MTTYRKDLMFLVLAAATLGACGGAEPDPTLPGPASEPAAGVDAPAEPEPGAEPSAEPGAEPAAEVAYPGVRVEGDRLAFEKDESILSLLEELEAASSLPTEEGGGNAAYERFEAALGFESLRTIAEARIEEKLENGWDGETPLDEEFVAWESLRALLNAQHEVQIGDQVIKLIDDETQLVIDADDPEALAAARADAPSAIASGKALLVDRESGLALGAASFATQDLQAPAAKQIVSTLTLQPDGAAGVDATVFSRAGDLDVNRGSDVNLPALAWTWSNVPGVQRAFMRFDLSQIPAGATIQSATLTLHGITTGGIPHSTLSGSNSATLRRVLAPWDESTVTWNNQPASDATGAVALPASTAEGQNYVLDVKGLLEQIIASGENNGWVMQLDTEQFYRALSFASSDHADPALRPMLEIQYAHEVECTGSADFSPVTSGLEVVAVASNGMGTAPLSYSWDFGDGSTATGLTAKHAYAKSGAYSVCLTVTDGNDCPSDPVCHVVTVEGDPPCCKVSGARTDSRVFGGGNRRLDAELDVEHFLGWRVIAKANHLWKNKKGKWKRDKADNLRVTLHSGKFRRWEKRDSECVGDYISVAEKTKSSNSDAKVKVSSDLAGAFSFINVGLEHKGQSAEFYAREHGHEVAFTLYLGESCPQ